MSPTKGPVRDIKVRVPRHNGQRIGPTFTAHVEALAKKQKKRVDIRQTAYDSSSIFAQAIESASEWNSLLLTARADRGPQWDIGTQQFHVDEYSDLYYDPTPLREHEKEAGDTDKTEQRPSMPPPDQIMSDASPQMRRNPSTMSTSSGSVPFSPRHPGTYPPQGMNYNNMPRIPPGQFYGNGEPGMPSPMRMGSIGGMGMPMGDMGMGGMSGGNMGVGGMGPMGMGSPDVRRSLRRNTSMGEEGFGMGGMH